MGLENLRNWRTGLCLRRREVRELILTVHLEEQLALWEILTSLNRQLRRYDVVCALLRSLGAGASSVQQTLRSQHSKAAAALEKVLRPKMATLFVTLRSN